MPKSTNCVRGVFNLDLRSVIYFLIVKKSYLIIYNKRELDNNINTLVWYPTVTRLQDLFEDTQTHIQV